MSQSPSILFINQHYWTDWAAMAQMPTHLAECLAAEGMDLHVLCSQGHYLRTHDEEGANRSARASLCRNRNDRLTEGCTRCHLASHTKRKTSMRITVRLPDDLGEKIKCRTDNVSQYVTEALTEKIQREERRRARHEILDMAGGESVDSALHDQNQRMRRGEDR